MHKSKNKSEEVEILKPIVNSVLRLNLYEEPVKAGFPSPAEGLIDSELNLNDLVINHPTSTFFVRVTGDSMENCGIKSGDILVVDRSMNVKNNDIIIAVVNAEFTVKRYINKNGKIVLMPENDKYEPIKIGVDDECEVWGVVTYVVHKF